MAEHEFYGQLAQDDVEDLATDLEAKADDSEVVHLAGNETIGGQKTINAGAGNQWVFNQPPQVAVGSLATHPVRRDDARLTDARTPTPHKSTHATGGTDALAPGDIGAQPADSDLTAIAGLTPTDNDVLQRKSGAWTNRTPTQLKTDLSLAKGDVGLGNVDNTSDASKPISTATQSALDAKAPLASPTFTGLVTAPRTVRTPFTLTYAATLTPDGNNGDLQRCTLTGASTVMEPTNGVDGQMLLLEFTASGADRVVTIDSGIDRLSAVGATLTVLSGKKGWVGLIRSGTQWYVLSADRQP